MTEAELIERAGEGDPRAIRELHDLHAPLVLTVTRRITGDVDQARDCAQEAWVRALRSISTYEGRAPFAAWIRRIAARVALQSARSSLRRAKREAAFSESLDGAIQPATSPLPGGNQLGAALLRLPEGMRRILLLHDVEGFTHEEIAEALGIAPGTSKSQLFKARGRMREMMRSPEVREGARSLSSNDVRLLEKRAAASWDRGGIEKWST